MKNFILLFFTFLSFNSIFSQSSCSDLEPICGEIAPTPSVTGLPSLGSPGCLGSAPNPNWYLIKLEDSGVTTFDLHQGNNPPNYNNTDIDFICWGPFTQTQIESGNACNNLYDFPSTGVPNNIIDCSYSGSAVEQIIIPDSFLPNQYYILLVTNFSGAPGSFVITPLSTDPAVMPQADCTVVCGVNLGDTALTTFPDNPPGNRTSVINVCDAAITTQVLHCNFENPPANEATLSYQWFLGADLQPAYTTKSITVSQSGTWRVVVTRPGCTNPSEDSVIINFGVTPVLNQPPTQLGPLGDCNPTFNLTSLIPALLAPLNPADFSVYFFTDYVDALIFDGVTPTGSVATPSAFQPSPAVDTVIYVRAVNNIALCLDDPTPDVMSFLLDVQCTNNATATGNTICIGNTGQLTFNGPPNAVVTFTEGSNTYNVTLNASGAFVWTTPLPLVTTTTYNLTNVAAGSPVVNTPLTSTATITVITNNTVSAPSSTPTICINSQLLPVITHSTTGATGIGTPIGLPSGISASWASNTITIDGIPNVSGVFNYSIPLTGGCGTFNATGTINVTAAPTATIAYAGTPFCTNNATVQAVTFSGTSGAFTGGTFSSTAGLTIDATTGAITPSTSTAGNYVVTYTIPASGGCAAIPVTTSVTITALPAATISYVGTPFCTNNATAQSVTFTGTTGGTYSSTVGLTIDATTGAITPSTSTAGNYVVTYTMAAANGCPLQTATTSVTITAAPTATITYVGTPFCTNNATAQAVTFTGTSGAFTGGTFSSTTGLTIDATTGEITPSTSTAGNYVVTYTIPASAGCGAIPVTTSVTITALPAATITYVGTPFCTNNATAQSVTFTGATGGTYSSTVGLTIDATTGAITPSTSTAGNYVVTYTMAAANGCPLQTATTSVTITAAPTATITYAGTPFCANNATVQAVIFSGTSGAFTGGTFSSTAGLTIDATTGAITPSTSTAGNYVVTYTIPASAGCAAIPVTTSVTITALPAATISYVGTPFCTNNATAQSVTFTGTTGGTYSSTVGLTIDATTGAITPSTSTAGNYVVTYTMAAANGCPLQTATTSVTITAAPTATITYVGTPFCTNNATAQAVTFTGTSGAFTGGTFSSTAGLTIDATTGEITPSTSTAGNYVVTYTIPASAGCAAIPVTTSVTITALPAATISYVGTPFCTNNATAQSVTFTGTTGGTYSSTVGLTIDATTGAITPSTSTAGNYVVTYTMAAANGCPLQTATTSVTITAAPTATIAYAGTPFCANNATVQAVTFSGTSGAFTGGTYSSTAGLTIDATTGAITPSTSTAGNYVVTYTIPASAGCATIPVTTSVTISAIPTGISITGGTTICAGGSANLTVTATPGTIITWSGTPSSFTIGASGSNVISVSPSVNTTYTLTSASLNGCTIPVIGQSATVSVSATPQFITQVPDITICNGGTLNIASQLTSTVPGTTFIWSATTGNVNTAVISGDETNIDQIVNLIDAFQNGTVNIEVRPQIGSCSGTSQQILVTVKSIPVITSTVVDKPVVCNNESVVITSNSNPVATLYNWQVNAASTSGVQIVGGATSGTSTTGVVNLQFVLTNPLVAGTISFDFTPVNGICTGATVTNAVTITVNPIPGTPIGLPIDEICSEETTNLTISSFPNIAGTMLEWTVIDSQNVTGFSNGTGLAPFTINQALINESNLQGYVVYSVTSKLGNCEGGTTQYIVRVNPLPKPNLIDGHICVNQTTGVTYQSYILDAQLSDPNFTYDWYVLNTTTGVYDILPSSNDSTYEVSTPGTYQVIVTNTVTGCISEPSQAIVTTIYPATAFTAVVTDAFTNNATITVTVNPIGTGNLIYSLDGGAWQTSNVFTGVQAGSHEIMVEDVEGCTNLTQPITVIDYPKYFTPNGDGIHDYWNVVGLNQAAAKLYIFDRYGKLIKQISPTDQNPGWDGTYNGEQAPSTDYWFTIDFIENNQQKQFKSHFSLKR